MFELELLITPLHVHVHVVIYGHSLVGSEVHLNVFTERQQSSIGRHQLRISLLHVERRQTFREGISNERQTIERLRPDRLATQLGQGSQHLELARDRQPNELRRVTTQNIFVTHWTRFQLFHCSTAWRWFCCTSTAEGFTR